MDDSTGLLTLNNQASEACTCSQRLSAATSTSSQPTYVYAIGNVEARFPTLSVEKEFAQAVGTTSNAGQTDQQTFRSTLVAPENRYLVRQLCWVLSVQGFDTYILRPRDSLDYELLTEAIRPNPSPLDLDAVIGTLGPLSTPSMCNGLIVPIVYFDQIYSFDRVSLTSQIPRRSGLTDDQNDAAATQILDRILRIADNAGAADEHRALNYLAMRYAEIYTKAGEQFSDDFSLTEVDVRPSAIGADRNVLNCIFTYTHRQTGLVDKYSIAVDVSEEFPFLVGPLRPYYDRV